PGRDIAAGDHDTLAAARLRIGAGPVVLRRGLAATDDDQSGQCTAGEQRTRHPRMIADRRQIARGYDMYPLLDLCTVAYAGRAGEKGSTARSLPFAGPH